jgi:hypothetical protein
MANAAIVFVLTTGLEMTAAHALWSVRTVSLLMLHVASAYVEMMRVVTLVNTANANMQLER